MKILITGTAGFIGFHLAHKLAKAGHEIVGLDSKNDYYDVELKYARLKNAGINRESIEYANLVHSSVYPNYRFVQMRLEDKENLDLLFASEKFDYVCNLAAQAGVRYSITNPYVYLTSNLQGFLNILEACKNTAVKHLAYASSSSVYGLNTKMPFTENESVNHPMSLYAASKKSNEMMAHVYSHLFNIPTTGLRFFTVYGPWGRPDMALFIFTKSIMEGKPIEVFNNGEMQRDFTYIDDIVDGIERVVLNPAKPDPNWNSDQPNPASSSAPYKIYNIGNSNPSQLMAFIRAIEKNLEREANIIYRPMQAGDVPATYADVSNLFNDLAYKPKTNIDEGVKNFINWYKEYYKS